METYGKTDALLDATIEDGRIEINANEDGRVYLKGPGQRPLIASEPHFGIHTVTDAASVEIVLDAEAMDALADAMYQVREDNDA